MPSWNIHMAQVERLLAGRDPAMLGIRDVNCFLFGNLVPDIYVGYMVKRPMRTLEYAETHFAEPNHVPVPDHQAFWDRFVQPGVDAGERVPDVVLGTWAHLAADATYNHHVREKLADLGLKPGRELRIRKQGDFDLFGRTIGLTVAPELTDELLAECAAFPQYPIDEPDVRAASKVAQGIVVDNRMHHTMGTPEYSLLSPEFFASTFAEVNTIILDGLTRYAATLA